MTENKCFVNENCIGCQACVGVAPALFAMKDGKSEVVKQPTTEEEKALFKTAKSVCPVGAIQGLD